jgi:hypothetical protein
MINKFETEFCKVNYLEKQNAVLCEWQQFCQGNDYREPLKFGLDLLLKTGATTWITDTTNGFENESEDTQWLIGEFLPKVLQVKSLEELEKVQDE